MSAEHQNMQGSSFHFTQFRAWNESQLIQSTLPHLRGQSASVSIQLGQEGQLHIEVTAPFLNNPAPQAQKGRLWGLWNYEVLEVFIAGANGQYIELEFGPHQHHLALSFTGVRQLQDENLKLQYLTYSLPDLSETKEGSWRASCQIPASSLPPSLSAIKQELVLKLNAFWCFTAHQQRYFCSAYPLPGAQADFHQPQSFPTFYFSSTRSSS